MVVGGNLRRPALGRKDRQLAHDPAQLGVRRQRMHAQGKGQHAQRAVGDVQLREHQQAVQVARLLRYQRDAAVDHLLAEDFDLLADDVVDRADDVPAQRRPGVAGQHRRKIAGVDRGSGLSLACPLHLGDRQDFVAGQVLRRQQQPHVQRPQLHFLVVAAEALVLDRLLGFHVTGSFRGRWPAPRWRCPVSASARPETPAPPIPWRRPPSGPPGPAPRRARSRSASRRASAPGRR